MFFFLPVFGSGVLSTLFPGYWRARDAFLERFHWSLFRSLDFIVEDVFFLHFEKRALIGSGIAGRSERAFHLGFPHFLLPTIRNLLWTYDPDVKMEINKNDTLDLPLCCPLKFTYVLWTDSYLKRVKDSKIFSKLFYLS